MINYDLPEYDYCHFFLITCKVDTLVAILTVWVTINYDLVDFWNMEKYYMLKM